MKKGVFMIGIERTGISCAIWDYFASLLLASTKLTLHYIKQ